MADNCGHAGFMRGAFDGDRMVLTTPGIEPVTFRTTWDVSDPAAATWQDELSVDGGPWQLIEQYTMAPITEGGLPPQHRNGFTSMGGWRRGGRDERAECNDGHRLRRYVPQCR
jgi:hypothetical protein